MQIREICQQMEAWAPLAWQESYDNAGLLVGDANATAKANKNASVKTNAKANANANAIAKANKNASVNASVKIISLC